MVHGKDIVITLIRELVETIEDERYADPSDRTSKKPPRTHTSALEAAVDVRASITDLIQDLV